MARPHKEGLDYFSFDVDFYENKKIRKIIRGCGPASGTILTCLLCNIYHHKGYYILWDEDLPFDIADKVGVSEGAVSEVINKALQVGFFDQYQYEVNKILTSEEIQKRYKSGTVKRNEIVISESFLVSESNKRVNGGNNPVNGSGNTQSKVKESKVKESNRAKALVPQGRDQEAKQKELEKEYDQLTEGFKEADVKTIWVGIKDFLAKRPEFVGPYVDAWNLFAHTYKLAKVETISDSRKKKFKTRIQEEAFDFLKVLEKIKTSAHLKGDNNAGWKATFDWVIENDKNYLKIIEGQYN